eukprot:scaffold60677_cov18-Prasinocladus_malaysianus.AAC.1
MTAGPAAIHSTRTSRRLPARRSYEYRKTLHYSYGYPCRRVATAQPCPWLDLSTSTSTSSSTGTK